MSIEDRISALGLYLAEPAKAPPGVVIDFAWARRYGDRVYISGHGAQAAQVPFGKGDVFLAADERRHGGASAASPRQLTLGRGGAAGAEQGAAYCRPSYSSMNRAGAVASAGDFAEGKG